MKFVSLALVLPVSVSLAVNGYCQWPPVLNPSSSHATTAHSSAGGHISPTGAGDTAPSSSGGAHPAAPGGKGPAPQPATPSGTAQGSGGGGGVGPSPVPTTTTLTMTNDDSWYLWWEFNKAEFLRPNRLDLLSAPASGDDALGALQRFADSLRMALGPALLEALHEGDPALRATAAVAYGRTNGASAIPKLVELLGDAHVDVRHGAILGLGATGANEAATLLLSIAKDGTLAGEGHERISPSAEAHAFVALALGRKRGLPAFVDTQLALRVAGRAKSEREAIGCAAMIYARLAPCPEFEALAATMAADEGEVPIVRCRAVEALATSVSDKTLPRLQALLVGPRLDLRRSAALALGELPATEALPALTAAYEQESESLTRGFILTAIGRRGGDTAREFLLRALASNPKSMHAWAALGLGILGRKTPSADIGKALREAGEHEANPQNKSAYWIAAGLLRDEESLPLLEKALAEASDPRNRMYAATALALLDGDEAHRVLRADLVLDSSPLVRASIAQALGCMGRGEDVDAIAGSLDTLNDPDLQAMAATALGFHASYDALRKLADIVRSKDSSSVRRAAAIEGAGMALGRAAPLALMDVGRDSNYTVFNEWGTGLYRTTL